MHLSSLLLPLLGSSALAFIPPQQHQQLPIAGNAPSFPPPGPSPSPASSDSSDFTTYQSDLSPTHSIRIKRQNASLCDTPVDQYTGWLDVGRKHFFFWYFASENAPSASSNDAPLALWMTGGPGGSSMLGMLQELGPCLIDDDGQGTTYNPYGWNKDTALIFVDQPAGVGFSYVEDGEPLPDNSFTSAVDMHLFLQLFVSQVFPAHLKGPFVITGESYAGHYIPTLAAQIVTQNLLHPHQPQVPLKSVAIGNGLISYADTTFGYWETLCTTNPGVAEPVFNETRCEILANNMPRCMEVLKTCREHPDPAICVAAAEVCWDGVVVHYDGESGKDGRNRYDISAPCEVDTFCYPNTPMIQKYLNLESSFAALGVPHAIQNYSFYSPATEEAFMKTVDLGTSTAPLVKYLLTNQIDVLIYSGNLDLACNTAGSKRWMSNLEWKGQTEFNSKDLKPWRSVVDGEEKKVGTFKEVNIKVVDGDEKRTRFALVTIDNAGHMVPQDQPEVSLDMLTRWLAGKSFA